jgi:hypothetical protein
MKAAVLAKDGGPVWLLQLAEYDGERWSSRTEWHLVRCRFIAPHSKLMALEEIRELANLVVGRISSGNG